MQQWFEINSPETLLKFRDILLSNTSRIGNSAYLSCDIDMTGIEWSPIHIGVASPNLNILEGNGYTIHGLNCSLEEKALLHLDKRILTPCPAGNAICAKSTGLLFDSLEGFTKISNLTVVGTIDLKLGKQWTQRVYLGGMTGAIGEYSEINNCNVDVDIKLHDLQTAKIIDDIGGVGGIAGSNEGKIINCSYIGKIDDCYHYMHDPSGVSFLNAGFIKNSYAKDLKRPNVGHVIFWSNKEKIPWLSYSCGIVDNIALYAPDGPYYTGRLKDFFGCSTLSTLLSKDLWLDKCLRDSYWYKKAIQEIADTVEASILAGATFGADPIELSVLPFQHSRYDNYTAAKKLQVRYSAMLEKLIEGSPSFRKAFVKEARNDNAQKILKKYATSAERVRRITKTADKYVNYDAAAKTYTDYTEIEYER